MTSTVRPFLELLDVGGPLREALLDGPLRGEQLLAELGGRLALALGDVPAALLGDAALLLGVAREGVGAQASERALELLRALGDLGGDDRVELALAALDLLLERARLPPDAHRGRRSPAPAAARATSAATTATAAAVTALT